MKETAINDNSMYSVKSKNIATMEYMAKTAVKIRKSDMHLHIHSNLATSRKSVNIIKQLSVRG